MQKKLNSMGGLRLLLWGLVLLLLIGVGAMIFDERAQPEPTYAHAVMVWRDGR